MKRGTIILCICFLFLFLTVSLHAKVKNPDTFILANYGNLRTLDPCVAYDVTSSQRLWNIYDAYGQVQASSGHGGTYPGKWRYIPGRQNLHVHHPQGSEVP